MASNTVRQAFRDALLETFPTYKFAFENERFVKPDGPWIMVRLRGDVFDQRSIGGGSPVENRWVEDGSTYLAVMVPVGSGTVQAATIAETLANLLRGQLLPGNIRLQTISIGDDHMEDDDGNWWPLVVRVDWIRG